jgi:hypothetical protein
VIHITDFRISTDWFIHVVHYECNNSSAMKTTLFRSLSMAMALPIALAVSASAIAQVNVTQVRNGTCYSGPRTRYGPFINVTCNYPSAYGTYSNVSAIQYRSGSGADVTWTYENPKAERGSINRVKRQSCVIGGTQYNQRPICNNPFRGTPVKISIVPHNNSWQTDFSLLPE